MEASRRLEAADMFSVGSSKRCRRRVGGRLVVNVDREGEDDDDTKPSASAQVISSKKRTAVMAVEDDAVEEQKNRCLGGWFC